MSVKSMNIQIPADIDENELKFHLAATLFEKGVLSTGQAASLIGISKRAFIESAGKYGVTIFGESTNDLKKIINK